MWHLWKALNQNTICFTNWPEEGSLEKRDTPEKKEVQTEELVDRITFIPRLSTLRGFFSPAFWSNTLNLYLQHVQLSIQDSVIGKILWTISRLNHIYEMFQKFIFIKLWTFLKDLLNYLLASPQRWNYNLKPGLCILSSYCNTYSSHLGARQSTVYLTVLPSCFPFPPPDLPFLLFLFVLGPRKLPSRECFSGFPELWPPVRFDAWK